VDRLLGHLNSKIKERNNLQESTKHTRTHTKNGKRDKKKCEFIFSPFHYSLVPQRQTVKSSSPAGLRKKKEERRKKRNVLD